MDRQCVALRGELAELEAVAAEIGEPDHLVLLVMVSQDQQGIAELGLHPGDPLLEVGIGKAAVGLKGRGARTR